MPVSGKPIDHESALRAAGIDDPAALMARVVTLWPGGDVPVAVRDALATAADPGQAVTGLERVREQYPDEVGRIWSEPERAARLVTLLGASQLATRLLLADVPGWRAVLGKPAGASVASLVPRPVLVGQESAAASARVLRSFKRRRILLIAARDLLGDATLEDTMAALTVLAEDALEVAIGAVRAQLVGDYGDVALDGRPLGFTVLGMGKLGGGELNFSSDIDPIYLYERDGVESRGGARGRLSAREFFCRLAEGVTRALHQSTDQGFVFRVDLRLRPEGRNGPIANSAAAALNYYESWGRTWERVAYLKARPVAGDRALGERFLTDLEPFVYRRFLDYAMLEDIKDMKVRIEQSLAGGHAREANVKLGRGGIREVEFLIQSLQLVNAGKDARIRERNSLRALERLAEHRYLDPAEGKTLADSYRFLRDVEHKIQLVDERQTHVIPTGEEEHQLARRLGYGLRHPEAALEAFRADCRRYRELVHDSFAALLHSPREAIARRGDARFVDVLAGLDDDTGTRERLRALGFRDVEAGASYLRLLRDGSPGRPSSPRREKLLGAVAPALLDAVTRAPDPDLALRNLATFLGAIGARSSFLALLAENPPTLGVLVRLFGSSEFLSQLLIRHPEMLDNLVRADLVRVEIPKVEMARELTGQVGAADDYETRLDVLRRFRHEQFLRIGINDLEGLLPFYAVSSQLSDLADVCLDAAWRVADEGTRRRYDLDASPARFTVLGMGKLGARELTYNSDLDLIFVYVPTAASAGPVSVHEYVTHVAQALMTALQVQTREGRMYLIDTRLRPSGNAGPLVSSLEAFARYHAHSARLWERQAMIKARAVAGDAALTAEVEGIVERFVYAAPISDADVAEIHRLRMRMERELAGSERKEFNIKTGRGGLVDIEFLTQMLQLRHGTAEPAVRRRATRHALAALAEVGVLPAEDAATLQEGYAFLRALTNRLRIERDQPVEALEREGERLPPLARRLGYSGGNEEVTAGLLKDYARHRERVRAVYSRWFGVSD
jgi:[glutamine synthetase] adenylyltransferase / [glutamine synthetase]-adenylyl-L-tyrosine phosphorylase